MSWLPPAISSRNGIIQRYIINITELNTGSSFHFDTTELLLTTNDLHPFYQYSIIVAAETVGVGPFSSPVFIELPEDGRTCYATCIQLICAYGYINFPLPPTHCTQHPLVHPENFPLAQLPQPPSPFPGLNHHLLTRMVLFVSTKSTSLRWTLRWS